MDTQSIIVDIIISISYWIDAIGNNREDALDVNAGRTALEKLTLTNLTHRA